MGGFLCAKPGGELGGRRSIAAEAVLDPPARPQAAKKEQRGSKQQAVQRIDDKERVAGILHPAEQLLPTPEIMLDGATEGFEDSLLVFLFLSTSVTS